MDQLDRRQVILAGAASLVTAAIPLGSAASASPRPMLLPKGLPVPPWIEVSTCPAFFGVAVEVYFERFSAEQQAKACWGGVSVSERLRIRAAVPLEPGECLIRCRNGAVLANRSLYAAKKPFHGTIWKWVCLEAQENTVRWTDDGPDRLLFANVASPEFAILHDRFAERIRVPNEGTIRGRAEQVRRLKTGEVKTRPPQVEA